MKIFKITPFGQTLCTKFTTTHLILYRTHQSLLGSQTFSQGLRSKKVSTKISPQHRHALAPPSSANSVGVYNVGTLVKWDDCVRQHTCSKHSVNRETGISVSDIAPIVPSMEGKALGMQQATHQFHHGLSTEGLLSTLTESFLSFHPEWQTAVDSYLKLLWTDRTTEKV